MSKSAVAHNVVPAANAGMLPTKLPAVPDSSTPSPIANTRNPAATKSSPSLKNFNVSNVVAITRPALSIAHEVLRSFSCVTIVPTMPNTAPSARPTEATTFNFRFAVGFNSFFLYVAQSTHYTLPP